MAQFKTDQEKFWAEEFGSDYIDRNNGEERIMTNMMFWGDIVSQLPKIKSVMELGCNIGINLQALKRIDPNYNLCGYEIFDEAAKICAETGVARVEQQSIIEPINETEKFDLTFTKGVLIHINPDYLDQVYKNLIENSNRYILVCEYYNPSPVAIPYRGHEDRLFKRDFAGDMMDKYGLKLIKYGFLYHRDNNFPQDDLTWFLMEK